MANVSWLDQIKWDDKGLVPAIAQDHHSGQSNFAPRRPNNFGNFRAHLLNVLEGVSHGHVVSSINRGWIAHTRRVRRFQDRFGPKAGVGDAKCLRREHCDRFASLHVASKFQKFRHSVK
jgi:hypothetical protein